MKSLPTISVIFPIYNSHPHNSLSCINSIYKSNYPKKLIDIIVVDNASTNDTTKKIKNKFPKVKIIKNSSNLGFSKAVNIGIKSSKAKLVFITNDDVILEKDCLSKLVEFLLSHSKTKVVGGKIISSQNPTTMLSSGHNIHPWTGLIYPSFKRDEISHPDWVQGCALLTSRAHLDQINYLDTDYYMYFEDAQLCFTTKKMGFEVTYYPYATIWHSESYSLNKNIYIKLLHWYKSQFIFISKNFPFLNKLSVFSFQAFILIPFRFLKFDYMHVRAYFHALLEYAYKKTF